jgi:DNA-binding transcriptional regulator/RsmH inhibitor MraZ
MATVRTIYVLCYLILGIFSGRASAGSNAGDKYPIPFELDGVWGAKDRNGVTVIPPIYKNALLFKGGISPARVDKKIGYIDQKGRTVIPFEYDHGLNLSLGRVGVCAAGKCGYLDAKGQIVIPLVYDNIDYFREEQGDLAIVKGECGWGVIDTTGHDIIAPTLKTSPSISDGFIIAFRGARDEIIYDMKGHEILSLRYDQIAYNMASGRFLNDNLFSVAIDGKWGFIDKAGRVVVPLRYDKRAFFFEGYAELVRDGKVYRVDKHGAEELIGDWRPPTP